MLLMIVNVCLASINVKHATYQVLIVLFAKATARIEIKIRLIVRKITKIIFKYYKFNMFLRCLDGYYENN